VLISSTAGTLYGKVLRRRTRATSIDTAKAEALPGVKAVWTAKDFRTTSSIYGRKRSRRISGTMTRNVHGAREAPTRHAVAA